MAVNNSKTLADPNNQYDAIKPLWDRSRALLQGERSTKEFDSELRQDDTNLLLPFSPSMTADQYGFFRNEAELPGLTSQYARLIIGGLLRKQPTLELPEGAPEGAETYIKEDFTWNNSTMISFLDDALWEEIQTTRAWIQVDYPDVDLAKVPEELRDSIKPYPVLHRAESVINWANGLHPVTGVYGLMLVVIRDFQRTPNKETLHAEYRDTVKVHRLDEDGLYIVETYQKPEADQDIKVDASGDTVQNYPSSNGFGQFKLISTSTDITINDKRMNFIPIYPLNGETEVQEPILTAFVDREVGLYNKVSRRNHLLYGAATFTPYVKGDLTDVEFDQVIATGLGGWLHIGAADDIGVLATPTEALQDYDRAIQSTTDEMSRMGMRFLAPEIEESGIALEIRNAAQTSQLGTLNAKISMQMRKIIVLMLNWRYGTDYSDQDVKFTLSQDFNPAPLGADWLRLVTEWYSAGIIPRSVFIDIAKQNDVVPSEYNDEEGQAEIESDELIATPREQMDLERDSMRVEAIETVVNTGGPER